jgi:hypothetical protein
MHCMLYNILFHPPCSGLHGLKHQIMKFLVLRQMINEIFISLGGILKCLRFNFQCQNAITFYVFFVMQLIWRAAKFRPMIGAQGLWAGRNLYRATPVVTWDLGFSGLIRRTAPISRLLGHTRGCGWSILIRILTGLQIYIKWIVLSFFQSLPTILNIILFVTLRIKCSSHCLLF